MRTCGQRSFDVVQRHFVGNAHQSTQRHIVSARVSNDRAEHETRKPYEISEGPFAAMSSYVTNERTNG